MAGVGKGLQHSSGRVIAFGRLMLTLLFLASIMVDASQPARAPASTYAILGIYIAFSLTIVVATWRNWWVDARLAGPAHAVDVTMFAVLVMLTENYTSPFFTFFVFVLLSAAIRWGWRATALSAILLVLLYLLVGLLGLTSGVAFEWPQFLARTVQLAILSLVLIWFGASQRWSHGEGRGGGMFGQPSLDESPLEGALRAARQKLRATSGLFVWREPGGGAFTGLSIDEDGVGTFDHPLDIGASAADDGPFLYDLAKDRGVRKDSQGNLQYFVPSELLSLASAARSKLSNGLGIPINASDGQGFLFLERRSGLAVDHIDLGAQIAAEIAIQRQRHALLKAAEESAEARSRLSLARDLHDSVVQFLAGAAFRLEAMKRSSANGRNVGEELNELKQLMLQEQRELRSFIKSLRSGPLAAFNQLAKDLEALAAHLSRQWDIDCEFSARPADLMIPTRVRLDAHQLTREAVANAVRHASAKAVSIGLSAQGDELCLEIVNDGVGFPRRGERIELPASLKERVEGARGTLDMSRGMGVTKISIALPIGEAAR